MQSESAASRSECTAKIADQKRAYEQSALMQQQVLLVQSEADKERQLLISELKSSSETIESHRAFVTASSDSCERRREVIMSRPVSYTLPTPPTILPVAVPGVSVILQTQKILPVDDVVSSC